MTIIPAIDIINGKCVRLSQGDYNAVTTYSDNPLEVAKAFEDAGLTRLHLVDLDGARMGKVKNWKTLETIASKTDLQIDFSGGISSHQQINIAFNAGAWWLTIGSMAVRSERTVSEWIAAYEAERFIISADVKNEKIFIKGWTESTTMDVYHLIEKYKHKGVSQFMCTDISCDGMLAGPSLTLYKNILSRHQTIKLIASGGVSSMNDLEQLRESGCAGAVVGKAIYKKRIPLRKLRNVMKPC